MAMMRWCGLMVLGIWVLAACSGRPLPRMDALFSAEQPISVREVWRHPQCGTAAQDAKITLFAGREAMLRWAAARSLPVVQDAGRLPMSGAYALIELGRKATAGHALAISAAGGQRGSTLLLRGTFFAPGADAAATETAPCVLVNLPPDRFETVRLYDQAGELRAMALRITPAP